ncbi:MAG: hypothetical protein ABR991_08205 [Terracidiphilus sp.]
MILSNVLLSTAAVLLIFTALVHSLLGERRLIGPLLTRREGVLASGLARFVLRFVWHLLSITWIVLALILVQLVRDPVTARHWAAAATGVAFTGVGLFDAVASRGRHIGWPLLTGIGIAALLSLLY